MAVVTTISTLRHAQTTYGSEKRYAGSLDVPLSDKGVQDCVQAASNIAGTNFDIVITSTLIRAIDTARLLAFDGTRHVQTDLCVERRFGIMEGLTWDEVKTLDPPILFVEVGGELHSVNPKDGEPFEDVWERAKQFKQMIFDEYEGLNILVVSHGVFLQMFHGVLRGLNCIESLGKYPANLELATFRLVECRLHDESARSLVARPPTGSDF